MRTATFPWDIRNSDFYKPDWHIKPTGSYQLMFEFLRVSPSYELARKHHAEGLSEEEKSKLPADFNQVLETYELFGDVQKVLFRKWWIERGLKIFGNPYAKPKAHKVAVIKNGEDIEGINLVPALNEYLGGVREQEGLQKTLLIALPLGLKKIEYKKALDKILAEISIEEDEPVIKPMIKLLSKRSRTKVLFKGLKLLWFKAAKPKWEEWKLGAKSNYSPTYSRELNIDNPRKTYGTLESYDREMMTKIVCRALRKYETIAENAARGKFPSEDPIERIDFNYPELAKRIKRKNTWEENEKARLIAKYQPKKINQKS